MEKYKANRVLFVLHIKPSYSVCETKVMHCQRNCGISYTKAVTMQHALELHVHGIIIIVLLVKINYAKQTFS